MRWVAAAILLLLCQPAWAQSRTYLTPTTNIFYVTPSGVDAYPCNQAAPCKTIQFAVDNIKQNFDSNCVQPWIYVEPGTYAGWQDYAPQVGCQPNGGGPIVISGYLPGQVATCNPAAISITSKGVAAVSYDGGAIGVLACMTINASGAPGVYATNGSVIEIGRIYFGSTNYSVMADAGGTIIVAGLVRWVQGAVYGLFANLGGYVDLLGGLNMQFASGIGFSQFAFADNYGKINIPVASMSVSGNPGGQKCYASLGGLINAGGASGSIPGTVACGSNVGGIVY